MGIKIRKLYEGGFFKRKVIEYELTYDLFVENLLLGDEFWFSYDKTSIDIAHYFDSITNKMIYHLSINDMDDLICVNGQHQLFDSPQELLNDARIDGKTIREIWDDLEN